MVGILLDTQPLYIKGVLPAQLAVQANGKTVYQYAVPTHERIEPARVSYHAAIAYSFTALFCWYRLNRGWVHNMVKRRHNRYEDIPDHHNAGLADGELKADTIPLYHPEGATPSTTRAYQLGWWSRIREGLRQWLAIRGWYYRPAHKFRRKREPKCV